MLSHLCLICIFEYCLIFPRICIACCGMMLVPCVSGGIGAGPLGEPDVATQQLVASAGELGARDVTLRRTGGRRTRGVRICVSKKRVVLLAVDGSNPSRHAFSFCFKFLHLVSSSSMLSHFASSCLRHVQHASF